MCKIYYKNVYSIVFTFSKKGEGVFNSILLCAAVPHDLCNDIHAWHTCLSGKHSNVYICVTTKNLYKGQLLHYIICCKTPLGYIQAHDVLLYT